jgi:quinol-cytochrome oxidoreductase complex cytochrome b subunit
MTGSRVRPRGLTGITRPYTLNSPLMSFPGVWMGPSMTTAKHEQSNPLEGSPFRRFWQSIQGHRLLPRDDRDRKWIVFNNLILHFRPVRVPVKTLRYTHTFGLGGMSLVLFILLVLTGGLMIFVYQPAPGLAYESVTRLNGEILFGKLVRNIHHWSANLLIVVASLHLLRVYFTGGFHGPRRFNWIIGLTLLACVLASNLTGYLLPWDQLSYWATTIVTGMIQYLPVVGESLLATIRGGADIGASTLVVFYALHTTLVPVLLVILMAWHFWRVRKARGVVIPRSADEEPDERPEYVVALPNLLLRELAVGLALTALIMLLALFFNAPLGDPANPGMSLNPAKAPWYFMGFQELLLHMHPLFAVLIVPVIGLFALLSLPYLRYERDTSGIFMVSGRGRRTALVAALLALILTPLWVLLDENGLGPGQWFPGLPGVIGNGVIPASLLLGTAAGLYLVLRKIYAATRNEAAQAVFVLAATGFLVMTLTGVWFRGEGMSLVWPWAG